MTRETYYYSLRRKMCKRYHSKDYTECPEPEVCPFAYCSFCNLDFLSLADIGDSHNCTPICKMFGDFLK